MTKFVRFIFAALFLAINVVNAATCVPAGGAQCPTPVTFSSVSPSLAAFDILGPIPPAWLFPIAPGVCTLNPYAIPPELSDPLVSIVQQYTDYCIAFLPCTPCYDVPVRPGTDGKSTITLPRDAVLQSNFSLGWWYLDAQMFSNRHGDDEQTCPTSTATNNVDVIMTQTYTNSPKMGGFGAILKPGFEADFIAQSSTASDPIHSTTGTIINKFAPNPKTGVSPYPWEAKYRASDVNMTFTHVSGQIGVIGAQYTFVGTTYRGTVVNLIGRDVSGVIEQGVRGFVDVPIPVGGESPLAGSNYFSLRLDIKGTVKLLGGEKKYVSGTSDFDFQWANGNPSPLNTASSWVWINLRLPSKCNLFINQQRQADGAMITGSRAVSFSKLNSPTLPSSGPGSPAHYKQLPESKIQILSTWKSSLTNITYPNLVMITLGNYAEFLLIPNFQNGEMASGPKDTTALFEVGTRVVLVKSSSEYEHDCPLRSGNDITTENIGVMEFNGFGRDTKTAVGLLEGGVYTSVSY